MAARNRIISDEELPELEMKLFVCTDHDKHQGEAQVSSFVLAYDEQRAISLLDKSLVKAGLRPRTMWRYALSEIPLDKELAEVLNDGDY
jgi:hypothetical protein